MSERRTLHMKLFAANLKAISKKAVKMTIHYKDGQVEKSEDLDWYCTYTGAIIRVDWLGADNAVLWSWIPEEALCLVEGGDQLTMPSRFNRS